MCSRYEFGRRVIKGTRLQMRKDYDGFLQDVSYVCNSRSYRNRGSSHLIKQERSWEVLPYMEFQVVSEIRDFDGVIKGGDNTKEAVGRIGI